MAPLSPYNIYSEISYYYFIVYSLILLLLPDTILLNSFIITL